MCPMYSITFYCHEKSLAKQLKRDHDSERGRAGKVERMNIKGAKIIIAFCIIRKRTHFQTVFRTSKQINIHPVLKFQLHCVILYDTQLMRMFAFNIVSVYYSTNSRLRNISIIQTMLGGDGASGTFGKQHSCLFAYICRCLCCVCNLFQK